MAMWYFYFLIELEFEYNFHLFKIIQYQKFGSEKFFFHEFELKIKKKYSRIFLIICGVDSLCTKHR